MLQWMKANPFFCIFTAWLFLFGISVETKFVKFYINGMFKKYTWSNEMEKIQLKFKAHLIPAIKEGKKTMTTRLGDKSSKYEIGQPIKFINADIPSVTFEMDNTVVTGIKVTTIGDLDDSVAQAEGYQEVAQLREVLESIYGTMDDSDVVTVISWGIQ